MPPGQQDEEQLSDDVRVGHVEVMLQRRDGDISVQLSLYQRHYSLATHEISYVLLHVVSTSHHGTLPYLQTHLRIRIVHEAIHVLLAVGIFHATLRLLHRGRTIWVAIAVDRWLLLRLVRQWRRAKVRHLRDVLRSRMEQFRTLCVGRWEGLTLHFDAV